MRRVGPGSPEIIGLTLVSGGANVAVFSAHADAIELCVFDRTGQRELERIALPERTGDVFHGFVADVAEGDRYGLRAYGPYDPRNGQRFNPNKLLVDPYVKALDRRFTLHPAMFGELPDGQTRNDEDSAPFVPKGIVVTPVNEIAAHHHVPWSDTIIYELHVRGFTKQLRRPREGGDPVSLMGRPREGGDPVSSMRRPRGGGDPVASMGRPRGGGDPVALMRRPRGGGDPVSLIKTLDSRLRGNDDVPDDIRGTCAGLAHPAAIAHLTELGVTTVELMPIAAIVDERHLARLDLTNYWGYNPIAFFVPDPRLAPGGILELRACVAALHAVGLEVVLDVVLNHTGEGDALGPTLSFRGLDNATYYRTFSNDPSRYVDDTGCGNTLALDRPPLVALVLDVLRSYAAAGIDGFRFDLGTVLLRRDGTIDRDAPLLRAIQQDPALRNLKLIAEPWDLGPGGYQLGAFPADWAEWNDRYRDTVRRFWRGDRGQIGDLATRFAGSSDVFAGLSRSPSRSIQFVAAHDGFTLADLVSYELKHNEANGENNRDGSNTNFSWNHGVEGATPDLAIHEARHRDMKSLLATLFVSRGTPLLTMGDELGRTQLGNNNAYAQDNAGIWLDWDNGDEVLCAFVRHLIDLRKHHPALRMDRWLTGGTFDDSNIPDVEWRRADGRSMTVDDWQNAHNPLLVAVFYSAAVGDAPADRVAIALNAGLECFAVTLPTPRDGFAWWRVVDTSLADGFPETADEITQDVTAVAHRSVFVAVEWPLISRKPTRSGVAADVLAQLAVAAGIAPDWWEVSGQHHVVSAETTYALLDAMGLSVRTTQQARERLDELTKARPAQTAAAASTSTRCFTPPSFQQGRRFFGLAAHLYALRRTGDQGIGDFTTLSNIAAATAQTGGSIVGINPLHALFADDRERASPYHPSDRRFLDPIYIDVRNVPDFGLSATARELYAAMANPIAALSASPTVDYAGVWQLKRAVLAACFATFEERTRDDPLVVECERFVTARGLALREFALFEAITAAQPRVPWWEWPTGLRRPDGSEVDAFAAQHGHNMRFTFYQQWLADRQFAQAADVARSGHLSLGFYRDLAVGAAPDGAEAWANTAAGLLAQGASIGAPPDPFSATGQIWNLPPPIPHALTASGYARFRELIAANMRYAGALRIDHVMGLARLFWVPQGATAADGAYVHYPLDHLLSVLAVESQCASCVVVGEDLGTVPEGLRERLAAADILSYRVLWFEREGIAFKAPSSYPVKAAACVSTHDLPTVAGWWQAVDIEERRALRLIGNDEAIQVVKHRMAEKKALVSAMECAGVAAQSAIDPAAPHNSEITAAIHRYAAVSASTLVLLQAEDLGSEMHALNLPGTDRERANWRRKVSVPADALWQTPVGAQASADFALRRS